MNSLSEILETRRIRSFSGEHLREIAFPLGGIGTGTVSLGGRGQLRDWEIFNRPSRGLIIPYTFASLWLQAENEEPVTRVLEGPLQPPYTSSHGTEPGQAAGLPRLEDAVFTGVYPFAQVQFSDPSLPITASLVAFNPLIPLNPDDSGLPIAIMRYCLTNSGTAPVKVMVALSLMNVIGSDGSEDLASDFGDYSAGDYLGQNLNEFVEGNGTRGIRLTSGKYPKSSPRFGSMALVTPWSQVSYRLSWQRPAWWPWSSLLGYWDDLQDGGHLTDSQRPEPSPEGSTDYCALGLHANLAPGESAELPFIIAWHFPNRTVSGCGWGFEEPDDNWLGNHYTERFADAWAAAQYTAENLARLEEDSLCYVRSMLASTLPECVLDAAMSNIATLRTQTCMRTADGKFHGFEGCADRRGSCWGTCTHVWNYEQVTSYLFPTLARSIRNTEFLNDTDQRGLMSFRTMLPLGSGQRGVAAADGQMGCIMKLYRDWQLSGDTEWLKQLWPYAKRALEFAWIEGGWDADQDGVMEGVQHNTYDIEYHGPAPQTGFWYLGALRAGQEMAEALGESDSAERYGRLFDEGSRWWDEHQFNGDYYVQQIRPQTDHFVAKGLTLFPGSAWDSTREPQYQIGSGCLADQLVGQWFAHLAGLGYLLQPDYVGRALSAIFTNNFKRSLASYVNVARTYALGDEPGLVMCTWPQGGRPEVPFPYFGEVWSSFEYLLAASLIYEGIVEPAIELVHAARSRHDGKKRNPWDEPEAGRHYVRPMAAWSLIVALSGFQYSAVERSMKFAPKISHQDFRCFWSTPTAWGSYGQRCSAGELEVWLSVEYGDLRLKCLAVELGPDLAVDTVGEMVIRPDLAAHTELCKDILTVEFAGGADIAAGEMFTVGSASPQQQ